jgi:hypothetical protein
MCRLIKTRARPPDATAAAAVAAVAAAARDFFDVEESVISRVSFLELRGECSPAPSRLPLVHAPFQFTTRMSSTSFNQLPTPFQRVAVYCLLLIFIRKIRINVAKISNMLWTQFSSTLNRHICK